MTFKLKIIKGTDVGKEFNLTQNLVAIGRDMTNDIILNDQTVSRTHAKIKFTGHGFLIEDSGSINGFRVNDSRTAGCDLSSGDKIAIGDTTFQIEFEEIAEGEAGGTVVLTSDNTLPDQPRPRSLRLAIIGIILIIALAASGYILKSTTSAPAVILTKYEPIPLPMKEVHGYSKKYDIDHADKVVCQFSHAGTDGRKTLHYQAGGTKQPGDVVILLNDIKISDVPAISGWSRTLNLELPPNLLKPGANTLAFDHTLNPATTDLEQVVPWGVRDVYLTMEGKMDCRPDEARLLYEQGKTKYEERDISYGNRYEAIQKFKLAHRYIEACPQPPEFAETMKSKLLLVQRELEEESKKHLFAAKRFKLFHNEEGYKNETDIIDRLITSKNDPLYTDIMDKLAQEDNPQ